MYTQHRQHISLLPAYMQDGMLLYLEDGLPPGGFMRAVLCNDLMGALGRADMANKHALSAYGEYLFNYVPGNSHGSVENYDTWIEAGGMRGLGLMPPRESETTP